MIVSSITFGTPKWANVNDSKGKEVYLLETIEVSIENEYGSYSWTIPKGFVSDLRSGPSLANLFLPKMGACTQHSALIFLHDYMYSKYSICTFKTKGGSVVSSNRLTKADADEFFIEGLQWHGDNPEPLWPSYKCWAIAKGLAMFGKSHFQKDPIRIYNTCKQEIETCR